MGTHNYPGSLLAATEARLAELDAANLPADIDHIYDAVYHTSAIFPNDTNLTCTFTAHANAHTWSAWTEITDSGANTLSTIFTANPGHITALGVEALSEDDTLYHVEIAYGDAKTIITRARFAGATKFQTPMDHIRFWTHSIPAGETIYYRMKTATAAADTATIHFRYHIH